MLLSKAFIWYYFMSVEYTAWLSNHIHINLWHYNDVIMRAIAFQITSLTIVYSTVYSDVDQRKHQRSASLVFVRGIHRLPLNSPHKGPVTRKMFPFDDVITGVDYKADVETRAWMRNKHSTANGRGIYLYMPKSLMYDVRSKDDILNISWVLLTCNRWKWYVLCTHVFVCF